MSYIMNHGETYSVGRFCYVVCLFCHIGRSLLSYRQVSFVI